MKARPEVAEVAGAADGVSAERHAVFFERLLEEPERLGADTSQLPQLGG